MKTTMKKRLQIQFVLLSVSVLMILETAVAGCSIFINYRQMTLNSDRIILSCNTGSSEIGDARYFRVVYSLENKTLEIDTSHTSFVTETMASEYAKKVIDSKTEKGYSDYYRYLVHRDKDTIAITFLSRYEAVAAFRENSITLIFISILGITVAAVILAFLSSKAVAPLVKNHQKQKEFITYASHELKTPLTVIHADAQLLESEIGSNEWLSDIIKQTENMTDLTYRLVYLAKTEEQNNNFVKIEFPISDVTEEVAESYCSIALKEGKNYVIEIDKNLSFSGDEKAIRELLTVLIDNSFKYSTSNGSIKVRLASEDKGIRLTVENTVEGIEPEKTKLFTERFYRNDTSDRTKGFGIGLSLAQVITEAHRGKITIDMPQEKLIRVSVIFKH